MTRILIILLIALVIIFIIDIQHRKVGKNVEITEEDRFEALNFETEYVTLKYPEEWREHLYVEEKDDEFIFNFKGEKGKDAWLATVYFGKKNKGVNLGAVVKDGKSIPVSVEFGELKGDKWTEDDKNNYAIMQEEMNELIYLLEQSEEYVNE